MSAAVADLSGDILGETLGDVIYLDADAAGVGWGVADPVMAVRHELGHLLGFTHEDAALWPIMSPELVVRARGVAATVGSVPPASRRADTPAAPARTLRPASPSATIRGKALRHRHARHRRSRSHHAAR